MIGIYRTFSVDLKTGIVKEIKPKKKKPLFTRGEKIAMAVLLVVLAMGILFKIKRNLQHRMNSKVQ